jgi:hypothetical protein
MTYRIFSIGLATLCIAASTASFANADIFLRLSQPVESDDQITPTGPNALTYAQLEKLKMERANEIEKIQQRVRELADLPQQIAERQAKLVEDYEIALRVKTKNPNLRVFRIPNWQLSITRHNGKVSGFSDPVYYSDDVSPRILKDLYPKFREKYAETVYEEHDSTGPQIGTEDLNIRLMALRSEQIRHDGIQLDREGYMVPKSLPDQLRDRIRLARAYVETYGRPPQMFAAIGSPDIDGHNQDYMTWLKVGEKMIQESDEDFIKWYTSSAVVKSSQESLEFDRALSELIKIQEEKGEAAEEKENSGEAVELLSSLGSQQCEASK